MRYQVLLLVLLLAFCTVSRHVCAQPDIELPFMSDDTWWCSQGWDGSYSHSGEAAWDYNRSGGDLGYPLVAPADGRVEFSGNSSSPYGNVVLIDYGSGYYGRLAHLTAVVVSTQEYVKKGQVVGFCGGTGGNYSPHIHYNTQRTADPADQDYTEVYVDYKDYQGQIHQNGYPEPCDCFSNPPPSTFYTSLNSNIMDLRKTTALNDRNPYGWPQSPATVCGSFNSTYWWHGFNQTDLYFTDNTSKRSYVSVSSNSQGGIVYDALGGARHAYFVGWEKWDDWEIMDISCGNCPNPEGTGGHGEGGPQSCLGMPITNSYKTSDSPEKWR